MQTADEPSRTGQTAGATPEVPARSVTTGTSPAVGGSQLGFPAPAALRPVILTSPRRSRGWLLALSFALAAAACAGGAWYVWLRPLPVLVAGPSRGPAIEAVYATGVVEAVDTARVGTTVAGRIVALPVEEGDVVSRGQTLAVLDDREAAQRLEDARARLRLAEQELARDRALLPQGVRSLQAVQRSTEERDRAAAGVAIAARDVTDYRIASPLDGIVMIRPVEVGETVSANAVLFTVASTKRLRVAADVDERDIAGVRLGAPMAVRADAFPDELVRPQVTNIRVQGDSATRTYRVEAALPPGSRLMIGMTVDVNIEIGRRDDALLVPESAIRHNPSQGGQPGSAYVFQVHDGRVHRVPVVLGAAGPEVVEIRDGLPAETQIVVNPPDRLRDGGRVQPMNRPGNP